MATLRFASLVGLVLAGCSLVVGDATQNDAAVDGSRTDGQADAVDGSITDGTADAPMTDAGLPMCPPGAAGSGVAKCNPAVDTECVFNGYPYRAHCLCNGYWETDQVLVVCDGGTPDLGACQVAFDAPGALCDAGATCPVVVNATITCTFVNPSPVSVAGGAGQIGYLTMYGGYAPGANYLVTVDPAGASRVDRDPVPASVGELDAVTDSAGSLSVVTGWAPDAGAMWYTPTDGGWKSEMIAKTPTPPPSVSWTVHSAAVGKDGRRFALIEDEISPLLLAESPPGQPWSEAVVSQDFFAKSAMARDGADVPASVYWISDAVTANGRDLYVRVGNQSPVVAFHDPQHNDPGTTPTIAVAGPGGQGSLPITAVYVSVSGLHLLVPNATTPGYQDRVFPVPVSKTNCPNFMGPADSASCIDGSVCNVMGDGVGYTSYNLARTDDGRVWFQWNESHTDIDYRVSLSCGGSGCSCNPTEVADRSTVVDNVGHVLSDGSIDVRWTSPESGLSFTAKGNQLYLLQGRNVFHYIILDANRF